MHTARAIVGIILSLSLVNSCKSDSTSAVKEFEFSSDICVSIQNATDTRWNTTTGGTKTSYHANLIAQERGIIDYELPRYEQRLSDMQSGVGPANGPGGKDVPLATAPAKTTADNPTDAVPTSDTPDNTASGATDSNPADASSSSGLDSSTNTSIFTLQGSQQFQSDALAREFCPGCSAQQVRDKVGILQQNRTKIATCQYKGTELASAGGSDVDPAAGLPPEESKKRDKDIEEIKNLVVAASNAKALCEWWGTISSGTGANRNRCQRETISGFCNAAVKSVAGVSAYRNRSNRNDAGC